MSEKKNLAAALIQAQLDMDVLHKDADNPFTKSKYSTLAAVRNACMKPLCQHGIAVFQRARIDEGDFGVRVIVSTEFYHAESGESFAEDIVLRPIKDTPQEIGSAITYGRRYQLMTMAGLAPEDDDGNAASGRQVIQYQNGQHGNAAKGQNEQKQVNGNQTKTKAPKKITASQKKKLHALGTQVYGPEWDSKRKELVETVSAGNVSSSEELMGAEASKLIDGIQKKAAQMAGMIEQVQQIGLTEDELMELVAQVTDERVSEVEKCVYAELVAVVQMLREEA